MILAATLAISLHWYPWLSESNSTNSNSNSDNASAGSTKDVTSTPSSETTTPETEIVVPSDPTLYLTIPRLGIYRATVRNEDSESALGIGAIKLPGTDFPWQEGDKNTYIACHRLGYPGTESYHECLDLPAIQKGDEIDLADTLGRTYRYQVSETLQVSPEDTWVTNPVDGREIVSLQTCIERPGDLWTLGPNWTTRYIVRADSIS